MENEEQMRPNLPFSVLSSPFIVFAFRPQSPPPLRIFLRPRPTALTNLVNLPAPRLPRSRLGLTQSEDALELKCNEEMRMLGTAAEPAQPKERRLGCGFIAPIIHCDATSQA